MRIPPFLNLIFSGAPAPSGIALRVVMKIFVSRFRVLLLLALTSFAFAVEPAATKIMPEKDIQPGMKGVAYTVFEGTQPEPFGVEVLGIIQNMNGPKSDVILVRLTGKKVEYTGVVAGMSGSPVYIDGKLVGAIAYRIGQFSKEPIAGVTPIEEMLEINELDKTLPPDTAGVTSTPHTNASKTSVGATSGVDGYAKLLQPIAAPLIFSGFSEDAMQRFAPQFSSAGVVPVMGAGSVTNEKQPEPVVPGSAVSAILVRGDMSIAGTCTVTYIDPERLLACGHPLLQFGQVDMPMTKARILATLPSPMDSFKIVNTTEPIGAFVQDRKTGILGRFAKQPDMIPVTLTVHGSSAPKQFHFEVLNNAKLTPVAMMATVFNALQGLNEYGEEVTYRLDGHISVDGYPDVKLQNMYAPIEPSQPPAFGVALAVGDRFGRIFDNPYSTVKISGVDLDLDMMSDRRWARLESARTDITEARPGDVVMVEAVLKPYRGERIVRQIPVKLPTSTPSGQLRILVSDADTLDRSRRFATSFSRKQDLGTTIASLNKEHLNDHLYVSLLEPNPQAMVADKVMPTLPLSVMNVMDGMRGTQEMFVTGESAVDESATPVDYVVTGAQVISITVK
jgi:SpoIVB peptidase S55